MPIRRTGWANAGPAAGHGLDAGVAILFFPNILRDGSVRSAGFAPPARLSPRSACAVHVGQRVILQVAATAGPDTFDVHIAPPGRVAGWNCIMTVGIAVTTRKVRAVPVPAGSLVTDRSPIVLCPASHLAVMLHAAVPPAAVGSDVRIELVSLPGMAGNVTAE